MSQCIIYSKYPPPTSTQRFDLSTHFMNAFLYSSSGVDLKKWYRADPRVCFD